MSIEWLTYEEIKNKSEELRNPELILDAVKRAEENLVYSLSILK